MAWPLSPWSEHGFHAWTFDESTHNAQTGAIIRRWLLTPIRAMREIAINNSYRGFHQGSKLVKHLARHIERLKSCLDTAKCEGIPWSLPSRGITGDLGYPRYELLMSQFDSGRSDLKEA